MDKLETLAQIYTILVLGVIIVLACLLGYRVFHVFIRKAPRKPIRKIPGHWYIKLLKLLWVLSVVLMAISLPFYIYIASAFYSLVPGYVHALLIAVVAGIAIVELRLALSVSQKLIIATSKKVVLSLLTAVMLYLSVSMAWSVPAMFSYPDARECYTLALPVKGTWHAGHAGGDEAVNYHCAYKSQCYAIDIVKVDGSGKMYQGSGALVTDFYTLGEPVYAPVNGVVVNVVDSLDNKPVSFDPNEKKDPAGNHVVIRLAKDRYVFLAHLGKGTISVKPGDAVRTGDMIGLAGNSGNTSWPHLHMHIQDLPSIDKNATGYPFRFRSMVRKRWFSKTEVAGGFLIRNDVFEDK